MKRTIFGLWALLTLCGTAFTAAAEERTWTEKKFGPELINVSGEKFKTAEALKGKLVLVYFSASWCPPCRAFTPKLVEFYRETAEKNKLAVVLIGSDRSAEAMQAYMEKYAMPWYAVPFGSPEAAAVKRELKVRGIPTLAVFAENGRLLTTGARRDVTIRGAKAVESWRPSAR